MIPPSWCGAPYRVQQWLAQGWPSELILASVREQCARRLEHCPKPAQYFEPGMAEYPRASSADQDDSGFLDSIKRGEGDAPFSLERELLNAIDGPPSRMLLI